MWIRFWYQVGPISLPKYVSKESRASIGVRIDFQISWAPIGSQAGDIWEIVPYNLGELLERSLFHVALAFRRFRAGTRVVVRGGAARVVPVKLHTYILEA